MPREEVCLQEYKNILRRERKELESRLQICEANEIAKDRETKCLRQRREKKLLATLEIRRLSLEKSIAFFSDEEIQMEKQGLFAVCDPETLRSTPFPSKLKAYNALKASASDSLLVYFPGKDIVRLKTYTEDSTGKPEIFAEERVDVYPIFFPPVAVLSSRLAIPSSEPCEACGVVGRGSRHTYGGACSRAFTTF
jgi:hypothetical protein